MPAQRQIDALLARFCAEIVALVRAVAAEEIERARTAAAASAPTPEPKRSKRSATSKASAAVPAPAALSAPQPMAPSMTPQPPTAPQAPRTRASVPSPTPTAAPDLAERLRLFVEAHAAYSARELADALGVRTVDVIEPLRALVEGQRVHKRIEGGQARYYAEAPPVDDEDD